MTPDVRYWAYGARMLAERLLTTFLILQARGRVTADELAREHGVTVRTVYRDLRALEDAGIPVVTERGPGGGCALDPHYRVGLAGLGAQEAEALLGLGAPQLAAQAGLGEALAGARAKLLATMPPEPAHLGRRAAARVHLDPAGWFRDAEPAPCLSDLARTVFASRRAQIRHRPYGKPPQRRSITPYGLVVKAGVWYLVAGTDRGTRVFRVSRIDHVVMLEDRAEPPDGFNLPEFWRTWVNAFEAGLPSVPVTLRVAPGLLDRIDTAFGEAARHVLEPAGPPNEAGWRTITLAFERLEYALHEIRAAGENVEVISPAELRAQIAGSARRTAAIYA
jgi:predicted DNA-binding transcriptional regulator YafY